MEHNEHAFKKRRLFARENGELFSVNPPFAEAKEVDFRYTDEDIFERHFRDQVADDKDTTSDYNSIHWDAQSAAHTIFGEVVFNCTSLSCKANLATMWTTGSSSLRIQRKLEQIKINGLGHQIEKHLLSFFSQYRDALICNETHENIDFFRSAVVCHLLCHVQRSRDRILKNNCKGVVNLDWQTPRDQGFTRPKVLVLAPFRNSCYAFVKEILAQSDKEQHENKARFDKEFGIEKEIENINKSKPADYLSYFTGNTNDMFCIGLKLTGKAVKLYSALSGSDIIIASPLGLRLTIHEENDANFNADFLSSIEILVIDQCEALLMQNWMHVEVSPDVALGGNIELGLSYGIKYILQHLNRMPRNTKDVDFSRVKHWYLDELARYRRQTLVFSPFLYPELNHLFKKEMKNIYGGKVRTKIRGNFTIPSRVRQVFYRFEVGTPARDPDVRFATFIQKILPSFTSKISEHGQVLIFLPKYHDYVRIRNHFKENNLSFESCHDHSTPKEMAKARAKFSARQVDFLLYTQRLHFFRRPDIKGAKSCVFYGLPDNPQYYTEILRNLEIDLSSGCTCLFSKYDMLKLERIVGDSRAVHLCESVDNVHIFE